MITYKIESDKKTELFIDYYDAWFNYVLEFMKPNIKYVKFIIKENKTDKTLIQWETTQ